MNNNIVVITLSKQHLCGVLMVTAPRMVWFKYIRIIQGSNLLYRILDSFFLGFRSFFLLLAFSVFLFRFSYLCPLHLSCLIQLSVGVFACVLWVLVGIQYTVLCARDYVRDSEFSLRRICFSSLYFLLLSIPCQGLIAGVSLCPGPLIDIFIQSLQLLIKYPWFLVWFVQHYPGFCAQGYTSNSALVMTTVNSNVQGTEYGVVATGSYSSQYHSSSVSISAGFFGVLHLILVYQHFRTSCLPHSSLLAFQYDTVCWVDESISSQQCLLHSQLSCFPVWMSVCLIDQLIRCTACFLHSLMSWFPVLMSFFG